MTHDDVHSPPVAVAALLPHEETHPMGDRANIVVKQPDGSRIYLYSHWGGWEMPGTLRDALDRHQRWEDPAYLTRIIFCEMVKIDCGGATGFGISTALCDNEYPLLVVDVDAGQVSIEREPGQSHGCLEPIIGRSFTFQEFADLKGEGWDMLESKPATT
jgi:hypothetical protein